MKLTEEQLAWLEQNGFEHNSEKSGANNTTFTRKADSVLSHHDISIHVTETSRHALFYVNFKYYDEEYKFCYFLADVNDLCMDIFIHHFNSYIDDLLRRKNSKLYIKN